MAFLVHPSLCLLLAFIIISRPMGASSAAALSLPEGLVWKDSKHLQVPIEVKRHELLALLSGLTGWASRRNEAPLTRHKKIELSPRPERATFSQPPSRDKTPPCKNFFWKTFSSC